MDYTKQEMMAIAAGREFRPGELAILGVGLSMLAGYFAKRNHAFGLKDLTESGIYGATPVGGLPWGVEDNRISSNATSFTNMVDALGALVASGRCDAGIIGAAQVDKFGNVNTTGMWSDPANPRYLPPKTRLAGSGGAPEITCGCKRYIIMAAHEKKRFVEKVDYITSPGFLSGGNARDRYNFPGGGPCMIVTTLCVMRPDPVTKEFMLSEYHPYTTIDEIRANTNWDLKVSPDVRMTPEPSEKELENLRAVDETGMLRKKD
jgi:glutaconate CoA-transferase subunit B